MVAVKVKPDLWRSRDRARAARGLRLVALALTLTAVAAALNRPPCAVTGVAPEAADSDTASGMFSARGNVALPGEELGPWITSEDLAALNLHEVRAYLLLGLRGAPRWCFTHCWERCQCKLARCPAHGSLAGCPAFGVVSPLTCTYDSLDIAPAFFPFWRRWHCILIVETSRALRPCALNPVVCLQEHEQNGSVGLSRAGIRARLFPTTAESDQGSSPLSRISLGDATPSPAPGPAPIGLRATLGPLPLRPRLYPLQQQGAV
jgi:hypothetical protein